MLKPMRVIAGEFRSRSLDAPPGLNTRPTSDRLRETLFNVLAPRISSARLLDLYAGSGAVGIEAISRGATHVEFVEKARPALKVLRENLSRLKILKAVIVHDESVSAFLRSPAPNPAFDIVFLDPPYDLADEYESVLNLFGSKASQWLAADAIVIAEHRKKHPTEDSYGTLKRTRLLEQGDAALSFYAPHPLSAVSS
jgi:16S rRNA (guanine966-N2)-methyltransferase